MKAVGEKIAVMGAGGFVGNFLVQALSKNTKNQILAISLNIDNIKFSSNNIEKQKCDVFATNELSNILKGYDVVYYLIHMMAKSKNDFPQLEDRAVKSFCKAANKAGIKKIVYLGGLGNDSKKISKHLESRHKTGRILRKYFRDTIEFRASIVIGHGSVAIETIKQSVAKLNFLILPSWANTFTQPICAEDVMKYLVEASDNKYTGQKIYELGGPQVLSYKDLISLYAKGVNKKIHIIVIHRSPESLTKLFLSLLIDKKIKNTVLSMVESLEYPTIVTNNNAQIDFPNIKPVSVESFFNR